MVRLDVQPAFSTDDAVAVVFASDANYVPYLAAALASLIDHASAGRNYDINILSSGIGEEDQAKVKSLAEGKPNISIRFLDVEALVAERAGDFFVSGYLSASTYYRLFAPSIFENYKKILYLDCDIIILADIAELFDCDLGGKAIGAARDYFAVRDLMHSTVAEWIRQIDLTRLDSYFNAGVLLMDVEKMRAKGYQDISLQWLKQVKAPRCHDQDVLNHVLKDDVTHLDAAWNSLAWAKSLGKVIWPGEMPDELYGEHLASIEAPKLLHYVAPEKPWHLPHLPLADKFWQFVAETPYYNSLMFSLVSRLSGENERLKARRRKPPLFLRAKYRYHTWMSSFRGGDAGLRHKNSAYKIGCRYLAITTDK